MSEELGNLWKGEKDASSCQVNEDEGKKEGPKARKENRVWPWGGKEGGIQNKTQHPHLGTGLPGDGDTEEAANRIQQRPDLKGLEC